VRENQIKDAPTFWNDVTMIYKILAVVVLIPTHLPNLQSFCFHCNITGKYRQRYQLDQKLTGAVTQVCAERRVDLIRSVIDKGSTWSRPSTSRKFARFTLVNDPRLDASHRSCASPSSIGRFTSTLVKSRNFHSVCIASNCPWVGSCVLLAIIASRGSPTVWLHTTTRSSFLVQVNCFQKQSQLQQASFRTPACP
jgi:hypothetical protein